jgi:uncharacterized membrane protein
MVQNINKDGDFDVERGCWMKFSTGSKLALALVVVSFLFPPVYGQPAYMPSELSFIVYSDGYVAVDYVVDVDPTKSRVDVPLFGELYEYLILEDQDGLILDSSPIEGGLSIDTLGAITVTISYQTTDLTSKAGQVWTFTAQTPTSSSVVLPGGAKTLYFSPMPLALSDLNGNIIFTMPAGELEITYTLGAADIKEHSLAVIKDAEDAIQEIKASGIIASEADDLLQQAYDAYDAERYADAELFAGQAKSLALDIQEAASGASEDIGDAQAAISSAEDAGRTVGLDTAEALLQQADGAYDAGDYEEASDLAGQAQSAAAGATAPQGGGLDLLLPAAAALVVVAAAAFFLTRRKPSKPVVSALRYDIEALFEDKPHLRLDDKEVIRFLSDNGGEAFAAEIRDRFNVPRTSLWRMIRRLEREEVVEVQNIGGQSLVRISPRYAIGGVEG